MRTNLEIAEGAVTDVIRERGKQDEKWGEQNHDPFLWTTILMEEVGEFSMAALEARFDPSPLVRINQRKHMRREAVQVAAVALAIVECLDRGKWKYPN